MNVKICCVVMVSMNVRTGTMSPIPCCVFLEKDDAEKYIDCERRKDENKFLSYEILDVVLDPPSQP